MLYKGVRWRVFLLGTSILLHLHLGSNSHIKTKRPHWQSVMQPLWFRKMNHAGVCTTDSTCKYGICCNNQCRCAPGFGGKYCNVSLSCLKLNSCSGHGVCIDGRCVCNPGWQGKLCSEVQGCPRDCLHRGICQHGRCFCFPGSQGVDCSSAVHCLDDCSGHGMCMYGNCLCDIGWAGTNCSSLISKRPCPEKCNGHGQCREGKCYCRPGYKGSACGEVKRCPNDCSKHGECIFGDHCDCDPGWEGDACDVETQCEEDCSGHGECALGLCFCWPGWQGDTCADRNSSLTQCPDCGPHGACHHASGKCFCDDAHTGRQCTKIRPKVHAHSNSSHYRPIEKNPPSKPVTSKAAFHYRNHSALDGTCSAENCLPGHGRCSTDRTACLCLPGWTGPECADSIGSCVGESCPEGSSGVLCLHGRCLCLPGHHSSGCRLRPRATCAASCASIPGSTCFDGMCLCDADTAQRTGACLGFDTSSLSTLAQGGPYMHANTIMTITKTARKKTKTAATATTAGKDIHLTISVGVVVSVFVAFLLGLMVGLAFSYLSISYKRAMVQHIMNDRKDVMPVSELRRSRSRHNRRESKMRF